MQYNVMPSNISLFLQDLSGLELQVRCGCACQVWRPLQAQHPTWEGAPSLSLLVSNHVSWKDQFQLRMFFPCHNPDDHQQYRLNVNNHYSESQLFYSGTRFSSINDMPFHTAASRPVSHPAAGNNIRMGIHLLLTCASTNTPAIQIQSFF